MMIYCIACEYAQLQIFCKTWISTKEVSADLGKIMIMFGIYDINDITVYGAGSRFGLDRQGGRIKFVYQGKHFHTFVDDAHRTYMVYDRMMQKVVNHEHLCYLLNAQ